MFKLRDNRKIERTKISGLTIIGLIVAIILFLPPLGWWCYLILFSIEHPYFHDIGERIYWFLGGIDDWFGSIGERIIACSLLINSIYTLYINILGIREIKKTAHIKGRKLSIILSIIGIIIAGVDTIFYIYYVIFVPPLSYYL
jgi:hypothetical protein